MYQNRAVSGICPLFDEKRDSYWMLPGYMKMLESQRAQPKDRGGISESRRKG